MRRLRSSPNAALNSEGTVSAIKLRLPIIGLTPGFLFELLARLDTTAEIGVILPLIAL